MKAMIFAAGLGTRLQPLTNSKPKALVEIEGIALLEIVIKNIMRQGFDEIIINLHHFAHQIVDFIERKKSFGIKITFSDETGKLLNTGGGLKKARHFLSGKEPFLVHNTDIISTIDLKDMYNRHKQTEALATLAVRDRQTSRYLLFTKKNRLRGWKNKKTGETKIANPGNDSLTPLAFSGIQIISPKIFELFIENGAFSIIDTYLRLCEKHRIVAYQHDHTTWIDVGKIQNLDIKLADYLSQHR